MGLLSIIQRPGPGRRGWFGNPPILRSFEEAEIVAFLESISLASLKDIRDKAIFSVLFYSWCRVSALINLTVADYYERGGTRWLRFQEKRGKEHEVPVHSKAKEAVDLWLERSCLASNPSAPLFPSFAKNRETIESRRLDRRSVLKLVEKRARTSGILKRVCCHSFRATGVTEYMNSGGTIEIAQRIAGHTSPATTRIYDPKNANGGAENRVVLLRRKHLRINGFSPGRSIAERWD